MNLVSRHIFIQWEIITKTTITSVTTVLDLLRKSPSQINMSLICHKLTSNQEIMNTITRRAIGKGLSVSASKRCLKVLDGITTINPSDDRLINLNFGT